MVNPYPKRKSDKRFGCDISERTANNSPAQYLKKIGGENVDKELIRYVRVTREVKREWKLEGDTWKPS